MKSKSCVTSIRLSLPITKADPNTFFALVMNKSSSRYVDPGILGPRENIMQYVRRYPKCKQIGCKIVNKRRIDDRTSYCVYIMGNILKNLAHRIFEYPIKRKPICFFRQEDFSSTGTSQLFLYTKFFILIPVWFF